MDARATRRGVPAVVTWGGLGALAWAALTVLTGGGQAHADEQPDGPADGFTSIVSETLDTVTAPVAPVVTQVVAPVVKTVVAPVQQAAPAVVAPVTRVVEQTPVVKHTVAPVVAVVRDTAKPVVAAVTEPLTEAPVSQITDPVVDVVTDVPVVGDLVEDLGVSDVVDDVVGIVDDTTDLVGGTVDQVLPPVLGAVDPVVPGDPGIGDPEPSPSLPDAGFAAPQGGAGSAPVSAVASAATAVDEMALGDSSAAESAPERVAEASDRSLTDAPQGAPPAGPAPASSSSSAASGGGSSGAAARLSETEAPSTHAWSRVSGDIDDALPTSPTSGTDVSPD